MHEASSAITDRQSALVRHWWWDGMYSDTQEFTRNCPQCTVVTGGGQHHQPPLHPIPVRRPFQIVGIDVMELPRTERGNHSLPRSYRQAGYSWRVIDTSTRAQSLHHHVRLSSAAKADLHWWLKFATDWNSKSFFLDYNWTPSPVVHGCE